ncbi:hypothetical protein IFM61392_02621 [Aspergillus lentulus]|nr:hypothetical protein IFM61392_02621 [Aspergillus lentulus]
MRCSFLFLAAALVAPTLAISEPAWMKYLAGLDEPADAAEQVDLNYLAHLADIADSVGVANPVTPDELAYLAEIAYLTDGKVKIRNNCPHKVYYWVAVPGNQYGPFAIEHGKESPPETITDGKAIKFTDTRNPPNSCKQVALGVPPGDKYNWEVDKISDGHEFRHDVCARCGSQDCGEGSDAGYLKEDGTLVLQGRLSGDTEVKLKGIRIDLTDVEQTVLKVSQGQLADMAACVRTNLSASGDDEQAALRYIVAYCIFSSERVLGESYDAELTIQRILETLPLPCSMRPSILFPVDDLPRTTAGKLDRRAPEDLQIPTDHWIALMLLGLWQCILFEEGLRHVDICARSDFFSDGGTSMLLVQLQQRVIERYQVFVTLLDLFRTRTLGGMAASSRAPWDLRTM